MIFKPTSPNQRFHSVECREAHHRRKEPDVPEETTPIDDQLRQRYIGLLFRLIDQGHEEARARVDRQLAPLSIEQLLALAEDEPWPALLDHIERALNGERPSG